jgi:hypothetical protein
MAFEEPEIRWAYGLLAISPGQLIEPVESVLTLARPLTTGSP